MELDGLAEVSGRIVGVGLMSSEDGEDAKEDMPDRRRARRLLRDCCVASR